MRALIADDEPALRDHLARLLSELWPELTLCASVGDGAAAREVLRSERPDVAFLDIRMPAPTGLELAREFGDATRIVFVTAYDAHAVEAFEHAAVDYLLKPVARERLAATVARLCSEPAMDDAASLLAALDERLAAASRSAPWLQWLKVQRGDAVQLLPVDEVLYLQADRKYTSAVTARGEHLLRQSISELEAQLDPERFWRIHRSTIVAVSAVETAQRDLRGRYRLSLKARDEELVVSAAYAHRFR